VKDLILRTQINEWRSRNEASEALFDLVRANLDKFQHKGFKMLELADALCKLFNDSNAKIQLSALENLNKIIHTIQPFIEMHIQLFYKALLTNLGSTNIGVRKSSESLIRQLNGAIEDKLLLLSLAASLLQVHSTTKLKPALIDQVVDLIDLAQARTSSPAELS